VSPRLADELVTILFFSEADGKERPFPERRTREIDPGPPW
jgi:hypothetical protein